MKNKKSDNKKLVVVADSPANLIQLAISGGADLQKLEKLIELQKQWEETQAKKEYHKAMTLFKADPPKIEKDKKVSFGNTKYFHASLANVVEKINNGLSKHGLSTSWKVQQETGFVSVTCMITHEQGHREETTLKAPVDLSGSKNAIQSIGSTISYLERYTLLALTGLSTYDMDDDGESSEKAKKKISINNETGEIIEEEVVL